MSFKEHKYCKNPPESNIKIWRYMNIPKFISILEMGALFFPKLSILPDKFEGYLSKKTTDFLRSSADKYIEEFRESRKQFIENVLLSFKNAREFLCVCSWHMNTCESAAMWNVYLNNNEGVAIQSDYGKLVNSFKNTAETINVGIVEYKDLEEDFINYRNIYFPALTKRKIFQYENELRALYSAPTKLRVNGKYIKVDLDILIDKIILAPNSEKWVKDLLVNLLDRYSIKKEVLNSQIDLGPTY